MPIIIFYATGSGPECSCIPDSSSTNGTLSCTVTYADSSFNPIPAIMTWIVNGTYYSTDVPFMNKTDYYVFTAISTITVDDSSVNSYQCILTFGEPRDVQYDWIATNAPEFSASCSTPGEFALSNSLTPDMPREVESELSTTRFRLHTL